MGGLLGGLLKQFVGGKIVESQQKKDWKNIQRYTEEFAQHFSKRLEKKGYDFNQYINGITDNNIQEYKNLIESNDVDYEVQRFIKISKPLISIISDSGIIIFLIFDEITSKQVTFKENIPGSNLHFRFYKSRIEILSKTDSGNKIISKHPGGTKYPDVDIIEYFKKGYLSIDLNEF